MLQGLISDILKGVLPGILLGRFLGILVGILPGIITGVLPSSLQASFVFAYVFIYARLLIWVQDSMTSIDCAKGAELLQGVDQHSLTMTSSSLRLCVNSECPKVALYKCCE